MAEIKIRNIVSHSYRTSKNVMEGKIHILRFGAVNRDIFNAIKNGKKKVETRAATKRYRGIRTGDKVRLICDTQKFEKTIKKVKTFKSIRTLLGNYTVNEIIPGANDETELRKVYYSFPGYREKIKKHGLIAFELQ